MKKTTLSLLFSIIFLTSVVYAQKAASDKKIFPLGIVDKIHSNVLSEDRILNIYLPAGYEKDTAVYPVLYLLDGSADEDFIHIVGLVQFLNMIGEMPNTIIVGIANVDRRHDFTFPTTIAKDKNDYPTTGSSEKFISFLDKELEPYIQKNYHCTAAKTILGQSLGGLVATEILLKKPSLFNNYIIVSPSLWWDNESLLAKAPTLLKSLSPGDMHVYISVGAEGKQMEDDAAKLVNMLQAVNKKNLTVDFVPLPAENHLTILHNSAYRAFQLLNAKK